MIITDNSEPTATSNEHACFLVGVTGYMDLVEDEIEPLKDRVRQLFHFLRDGAAREPLRKLIADLVPDPNDRRPRSGYRTALSRWTGLGPDTPIVVLCNLAPGIDTLVANLVLDEFAGNNFQLRCPLPFPPHIYCGASTFVRIKDGQPVEGNRERQRDFLAILAKMGAISRGFVDLADGNPNVSTELSEALKGVSPETFFAVRLQEDLALDAPALERKWLDDCGDSDRRNLRYYAAGEYLAVSAHLMLAAWNGQRDNSRSGTSTVVEARLSGPRRRLLPTTSELPLQHGGPVWHLLANRPASTRPEKVDSCAQTRDMAGPLPPVCILHPFPTTQLDCFQTPIIAANQSADIELQSNRLSLFARIGESLRNFNLQKVSSEKDRAREVQKMLADPPGTQFALRALIEQQSPRLGKRLREISDIRCRSSDLTTYYQELVKTTLSRLFWMTFFAAVALHFLTHWHPRAAKQHPQTASSQEQAAASQEAAQPPADSHSRTERLNRIQLAAGWLAFGLTAAGIAYFSWQRSRKLEAHGHDARAIAEGLRVQFYWNLAGLGKSVSANYMSRHRSELDWIRGVIRATSIPYDIWTFWFAKLEPATKLAAFRVVHNNWVRDQLEYFRRASHREHHRLHAWHKFGGVAALAGVLTFLKIISQESWSPVATFVELACQSWVAVPLLAATGCLAWYLARRAGMSHGNDVAIFPELAKTIKAAQERAGKRWKKDVEKKSRWRRLVAVLGWFGEWLRSAGGIILEVVYVLVPTRKNSAITHTTFARRLGHGVTTLLAHLPMSMVVACVASGSCHLIADSIETFPGPMTLSFIASGTLLLGGALSVAWAEKNLYSELAYQYNTMAILFEAATQQLAKELTEFQTAIDFGKDLAQRQSTDRIQALLYELGQEALDENAEWLLLHRARPLEPVMAG